MSDPHLPRSPSAAPFPRIADLECESASPPGYYPLQLTLVPSGVTLQLPRPDNLVGRHSACDLRLRLPDVSRRHCRISFHDGAWHVHDLNSLNGVYLNDEKITDSVLRPLDRIVIGGFILIADVSGVARDAPWAA